jgi:hypothetical protein
MPEGQTFEVSWGNPKSDYSDKSCSPDPPITVVSGLVFPNGAPISLTHAEDDRVSLGSITQQVSMRPWCNRVNVGPTRITGSTVVWPPYPVEVKVLPSREGADAHYAGTVRIDLINKSGAVLYFTSDCPIATLEVANGFPNEPEYEFFYRSQAPLDCASHLPIQPGGKAMFEYELDLSHFANLDPQDWKVIWYAGDGSDPRARASRDIPIDNKH